MEQSLRPLDGLRVLLAEDESLIAMFLARLLGSAGACVTTVATVKDGLDKAAAPYDAALLDVGLRDGEVFPLADALYRQGVPIVFHTGHGLGHDGLARYGSPVTLAKPAHRSEIVTAVYDSAVNPTLQPAFATEKGQ